VIVPGSRLLARYRWGFYNPFDPKRPLVNARADKVAKSPVFRKAFRETRCLVPVDGYYEYRQSDPAGRKRRYLFQPDNKGFAVAGMGQQEGEARTYTFITTEPNGVAAEIHNRMPVLLHKADYDRWLDPAKTVDDLLAMLRPWDGPLTATETPKGVAKKEEA